MIVLLVDGKKERHDDLVKYGEKYFDKKLIYVWAQDMAEAHEALSIFDFDVVSIANDNHEIDTEKILEWFRKHPLKVPDLINLHGYSHSFVYGRESRNNEEVEKEVWSIRLNTQITSNYIFSEVLWRHLKEKYGKESQVQA